jgi:hypothetical protein
MRTVTWSSTSTDCFTERTWWFELQIPQEYWEDLPYATEEHGPQTVSSAYTRAGVFWERLAKENADSLEQLAVPGASNRHIKKVWPDYRTLELEYHRRGP